jgi:hypothetical protein
MNLTLGLRRLALTAHVGFSVGWLGAVAGFLALAVAGVMSKDAETVRGAYLLMEMTGWVVLVPLSLASLITGLVSSIGTSWGLFRHYWVVVKLLINITATSILLLYMQTLGQLADEVRRTATSADVEALRSASPVLHAAAALVLLLAATTLAVYKPRGLTRYGWRKQIEQRSVAQP